MFTFTELVQWQVACWLALFFGGLFCAALETWIRMASEPYVDAPDDQSKRLDPTLKDF